MATLSEDQPMILHSVQASTWGAMWVANECLDVVPEDRLHIRVGLHVGDVVHKEGDIHGDAVNIAARIEPLADTDGICLSEDVARQVEGKIEEPIERIGRGQLKNITLPVAVYRIALPWSRRKPHKTSGRVKAGVALVVVFLGGFLLGHFWEPHWGTSMQHAASVGTVSFSPNGRLLASGSEDKTVRIWDVGKQKELRELTGHTRAVYSVAFSPDGKLLASGSVDRTVKLWDVSTGREVRTLKGHARAAMAVAFSPNGTLLASAGDDRTILLWNVSTGQQVKNFAGHKDAVQALAFSPDGQWLASGSADETIRIWDVESGRELRTLTGHADAIESLAFERDGRWLASASADDTVKVWDPSTGTELRTLAANPTAANSVLSVAFDPNGHQLASGGDDGVVQHLGCQYGAGGKQAGHSRRASGEQRGLGSDRRPGLG